MQPFEQMALEGRDVMGGGRGSGCILCGWKEKQDMTEEMSPDPETVARRLQCHHKGAPVSLPSPPLIPSFYSLFCFHSSLSLTRGRVMFDIVASQSEA